MVAILTVRRLCGGCVFSCSKSFGAARVGWLQYPQYVTCVVVVCCGDLSHVVVLEWDGYNTHST